MQRIIVLMLPALIVLAFACSNKDSGATATNTAGEATATVGATDTPALAPTDTPVPPAANTAVEQQQQQEPPTQPATENCDRQSYPDVCIAPYPPDLDCGEVPYRRFTVRPPDPHGFDRDGDGVGCESG